MSDEKLYPVVRLKGHDIILKLGDVSTTISTEEARHLANTLLSRIGEVAAKQGRELIAEYKRLQEFGPRKG